jgi:hypothetical protein
MYCANCNSPIEKGSKFCHNCGININSSSLLVKPDERISKQSNISKIDNTKTTTETAEEYLLKTNVKDREQAREMLARLKLLFWVVGIFLFIINILNELVFVTGSELYYLIVVPYAALVIYFIYYCTKVLTAIKKPRANATWCFIFAPIGWFYLYPMMTKPLKIILGELPVPNEAEESEKKRKSENSIKKFRKRFWIVTAILLLLFILLLVSLVLIT